ncbi:MAG TPA: helix-turn-helix transcriptional regulator [Baekduia sp.]|jgi:DNA-binding NarL/FixJ family response regulator
MATEAHHGWALARAGDLPGAEAYLRAGLSATDATADPIALASQLFYGEDAVVERESLDDVAELVERLDATPLTGMVMEMMVRSLRGRMRLLRRDAEGALEDLRAAHAVALATGMGPAVGPSRSLLALALPAGEREAALALVEEELALARAAGLPRAEGIALRAGGLLRDGAEAIALLEASVAVLAPSPARLEHARSLVALRGALRRMRRPAAAREPLAAGLELAHACGATRLETRAREELRAAGGRPRRIARTGRDALTASEQRIARLACDGASNPEIAQELFLSLKTIETHLTSVYRKLGLAGHGSRERLAEALATPTPVTE